VWSRTRALPVGAETPLIKRYLVSESGQSLTEYAAIVALVALTVLLLLVAFRDEIARVFKMMLAEAAEVEEQMKTRPGLGQGAGCQSVGGCKR
jgi:Flp pilus assembly pilin Flp